MQFCVGFKFRKFSQSDVMVHSKNLDNSIIGLFCENLNNFSTILAFDGLKNGIRDFVCLYIIIYFNSPPELFFLAPPLRVTKHTLGFFKRQMTFSHSISTKSEHL